MFLLLLKYLHIVTYPLLVVGNAIHDLALNNAILPSSLKLGVQLYYELGNAS